jgi:glycosyltransferase involved in cell wall biosynthesis
MVTRDYPPTVGGIATHTKAVVDRLRDIGVDVEAIVGRSDFGTLMVPLRRSLSGYDIVHVQSSPYGAFVKNECMVVTVHAPVLSEKDYYRGWTSIKSRFAVGMERRTFAKASRIIAVSEWTKFELVRLYALAPERIKVIPNGVDLEAFGRPTRTMDDGLLRVLVVSRLEPRKNVADVIHALSGAAATRDLGLEIVGEGTEKGKLVAIAKKERVDVRFTGRVASGLLAEAYGRSSVVVAPGMAEGFGLTILEGWAAGCAVVASDSPAHRELVSPGVDGFLYSTTSELKETLSMLATDRKALYRIAEQGRKRAQLHDWREVAKSVAGVYDELVVRGPS